jgi:hypothetical protein
MSYRGTYEWGERQENSLKSPNILTKTKSTELAVASVRLKPGTFKPGTFFSKVYVLPL